jgi:hypothetical protein
MLKDDNLRYIVSDRIGATRVKRDPRTMANGAWIHNRNYAAKNNLPSAIFLTFFALDRLEWRLGER